MKCFIIAAISADGFIAKNEHHAAMWSSKEDKRKFVELTKRAGVIVMGSNTFATLPRPLKDRLNIVYSKSKKFEGAESTAKDPVELLRELESRGYKEVAICGGASIYSLFMKAGIVNTIYLTIEPLLFGSGISLFREPIDSRLKLVSIDKTDTGTILLEYEVLN